MRFLIIEPCDLNGVKSGRGARGKNLQVFLNTYFGRKSTLRINYKQINRSMFYNVDHLFIGVPSALSSNDMKQISSRTTHLFDYGDNEGADWGGSDSSFLLSLCNSYLKPWVQDDWEDGVNWGTLPIRRKYALSLSLKYNRFMNRNLYSCSKEREFDTSFLGNPIVGWKEKGNSKPRYIRIEWLDEISSQQNITFSGGFFMRGETANHLKESSSQSLQPLFLEKGRSNFFSYFNLMTNSKSALVPPGNALWSYRHYESIYAGAVPVSVNFKDAKMLIPLPIDGMVHVEPGESSVCGVEIAIKMLRDSPTIPLENFNFTEQFLTDGHYDKKKKMLISRFMAQLGGD